MRSNRTLINNRSTIAEFNSLSDHLSANRRFLPLSPCGRGCLREAKAGEGLVLVVSRPLTRLNLATLDFATLSHKGRGEERTHDALSLPPCKLTPHGESGRKHRDDRPAR